jgi:hypothetical protein
MSMADAGCTSLFLQFDIIYLEVQVSQEGEAKKTVFFKKKCLRPSYFSAEFRQGVKRKTKCSDSSGGMVSLGL